MQNTNRKIEEFIDEKLRSSQLSMTSGDFGVHLMKRLAEEQKTALEQRKGDKLVKYAIGSFSFLILGLTVSLGYLSGSTASANNTSRGINLGPAVETSNNYVERFIGFFQSVFVNILNFFGLSANPKTFTIIAVVLLVISVFLVAERFVLRGRFRSSSVSVK